MKNLLNIGWSLKIKLKNNLVKTTNFSYGIYKDNNLISFMFGDLINIEKISEYEILVLYVLKNLNEEKV